MKHQRTTRPGQPSAVCKRGHSIGLDIGATAVRAAQVRTRMVDGVPDVLVERGASVPLPTGTVVNGFVEDAAALTAAVKSLWRAGGFHCDHVVLGVSNPQVLVREMTIPHLPEHQHLLALPFQARDVITLPLEEVVLDFVRLGPPDPETNQVKGLLVASPREPVLVAVRAVEAGGVHVARVDLAPFAVLRAVAEGYDTAEVVVDLGAHLTTIVIHDRGVPRLVRTLGRGGDEITSQLAQRLDLSLEQAEQAKRSSGLIEAVDRVSHTVEETVRPLLSEIRSSLNYFRTGNPGVELSRISLTGGAAQLPGLGEVLSQQNGAPVHIVDQLEPSEPGQPDYDLGDDEWATALSVGLAMGRAS